MSKSKKLKRNISGNFDFSDMITRAGYHTLDQGWKGCYIKSVEYKPPITLVKWNDNTVTVSKCSSHDTFTKDMGLTICVLKKLLGSTKYFNLLEDWVTESNYISISDVRKSLKIKKSEG